MKMTTILISIFLCFSFTETGFTQTITAEGNQWNIFVGQLFTAPPYTYSLRVDGDTTINGSNYKKVYQSLDSLGNDWTLYHTVLRQEGQQVYAKPFFQNEFLLYDFSLTVGDTLGTDYFDDDFCKIVVTEVDSIMLNNGEMRKRLKVFAEGGNPDAVGDHWIEGIGSIKGLTNHIIYHCASDYVDELFCYYHMDDLLYPESPSTCFFTTPVRELTVDDKIDIFPNPAINSLTIQDGSGQDRIREVFIYDAMGAIIQRKLINDTSIELSLSNIPTGIYYLLLRFENKDILTKRIVKTTK